MPVTPKSMIYTAIPDFPMVQSGDDLAVLIVALCKKSNISIEDGDIFVLAQKIVSKAEGRLVNYSSIVPSPQALELEKITQKDPRFIELVLTQCKKVIRAKFNTLIVEHKKGFICANAGIDHSNLSDQGELAEDWVLLLPEDSDISAKKIRFEIEKIISKRVGILIIDSHGRPWRNGTVGVTIGVSGLPALVDLRGQEDLAGFKLKVTTVGVSDELAAGASLLMGQTTEKTPVIHVRGFPYSMRESTLQELIRPEEEDLFR
ncbi:MAG: coenzyme F420-0:L-glutamate ligase [Anaerolinea sp.]|nr:coenzyme F420-0:L-glutamate ligase [Anaerolinea sp.]